MNSMWKLVFIPLFTLSVSAILAQNTPAPPAQTNEAPEKIVRVSGGVAAALRTHFVLPLYPPEARAKHIAGAVVLHVVIGKDGIVKTVEVISGPEELRAAYIDAVRQWRYKPYLLNGEPVAIDTTIALNIQMSGAAVDPPLPHS